MMIEGDDIAAAGCQQKEDPYSLALHEFNRSRTVENFQLLLRLTFETGQDIEVQFKNGYTLLHYAVKFNCEKESLQLLKAGVSVFCKTNNDKTPMDIALENGNQAILLALQKYAGYQSKNFSSKSNPFKRREYSLDGIDFEETLIWEQNALVIYHDYLDWSDSQHLHHLEQLIKKSDEDEARYHTQLEEYNQMKKSISARIKKMYGNLRDKEHVYCLRIYELLEFEKQCRKDIDKMTRESKSLKDELHKGQELLAYKGKASVRTYNGYVFKFWKGVNINLTGKSLTIFEEDKQIQVKEILIDNIYFLDIDLKLKNERERRSTGSRTSSLERFSDVKEADAMPDGKKSFVYLTFYINIPLDQVVAAGNKTNLFAIAKSSNPNPGEEVYLLRMNSIAEAYQLYYQLFNCLNSDTVIQGESMIKPQLDMSGLTSVESLLSGSRNSGISYRRSGLSSFSASSRLSAPMSRSSMTESDPGKECDKAEQSGSYGRNRSHTTAEESKPFSPPRSSKISSSDFPHAVDLQCEHTMFDIVEENERSTSTDDSSATLSLHNIKNIDINITPTKSTLGSMQKALSFDCRGAPQSTGSGKKGKGTSFAETSSVANESDVMMDDWRSVCSAECPVESINVRPPSEAYFPEPQEDLSLLSLAFQGESIKPVPHHKPSSPRERPPKPSPSPESSPFNLKMSYEYRYKLYNSSAHALVSEASSASKLILPTVSDTPFKEENPSISAPLFKGDDKNTYLSETKTTIQLFPENRNAKISKSLPADTYLTDADEPAYRKEEIDLVGSSADSIKSLVGERILENESKSSSRGVPPWHGKDIHSRRSLCSNLPPRAISGGDRNSMVSLPTELNRNESFSASHDEVLPPIRQYGKGTLKEMKESLSYIREVIKSRSDKLMEFLKKKECYLESLHYLVSMRELVNQPLTTSGRRESFSKTPVTALNSRKAFSILQILKSRSEQQSNRPTEVSENDSLFDRNFLSLFSPPPTVESTHLNNVSRDSTTESQHQLSSSYQSDDTCYLDDRNVRESYLEKEKIVMNLLQISYGADVATTPITPMSSNEPRISFVDDDSGSQGLSVDRASSSRSLASSSVEKSCDLATPSSCQTLKIYNVRTLTDFGPPPKDLLPDYQKIRKDFEDLGEVEFQLYMTFKKLAQTLVLRDKTWHRLRALQTEESIIKISNKHDLYDVDF